MKKIMSLLLFIGIFLISNNVQAQTLDSDDVPNNSYVIGEYVFSANIALTTKHIMLAAKSISGNNLEDMVIYYKTPKGKWIAGDTGVDVTAPDSFEISYKDLNEYIATPVLTNTTLSACGNNCDTFVPTLADGKYTYDLGINSINYTSHDGYEVYEKVGQTYTKIGTGTIGGAVVIEVEPGEKKTYVARVYKANGNSVNIYSDYSNEIVIDHSTYQAPVLTNTTLSACGNNCDDFVPTLADGKYTYDLGINNLIYMKTIGTDTYSNVSGYEVYEKVGQTYTKIGTGTIGGAVVVEIEPGEKKTYVARVYATDSESNNVYSDYSNEIVIDHSTMKIPTLSATAGSPGFATYSIFTSGNYSSSSDNIDGWELYEKTGEDTYVFVKDCVKGSSDNMSVEPNETRTFVARVYALNTQSQKVYSEYSNEVTLSNPVLVPTLSATAGSPGFATYSIFTSGNYSSSSDNIDGWELYEKTGEDTYVFVKDCVKGSSDNMSVEPNETRTFVARAYALNTQSQKVYSEYSTEVTLTNPVE